MKATMKEQLRDCIRGHQPIPRPIRHELYKMMLVEYLESAPSGLCKAFLSVLCDLRILIPSSGSYDKFVIKALPELAWYAPMKGHKYRSFWWKKSDELSRINALLNCINLTS